MIWKSLNDGLVSDEKCVGNGEMERVFHMRKRFKCMNFYILKIWDENFYIL